MANILLLDDNIRAKLKELKVYAEKHPYSMDDLLDIRNGSMRPPGDEEHFSMEVPVGMKLVMTLERQPKMDYWHISISNALAGQGKLPNPDIVAEIMNELGLSTDMEDWILDNNAFLSGIVSIHHKA